jgi:hypothetical protein
MADQPTDGYIGQKELNTGNSEFNKMSFVIKMAMARINVATLVQVAAVYPGVGTPDECGSVDVLPLVGLVDGAGTVWPQTTIFGLPYFRLQGGAAAVILDPIVGDVGLAVFCDKDMTSIKATNGQAGAPPTARRFDLADGFYVGGWMPTVEPTTFINITGPTINSGNPQAANTVSVVTPANMFVLAPASVTMTMGSSSIVVSGSGITLNGNTTVNGTLTGSSTASFTGEVKTSLNGTTHLSTHTHQVAASTGTPTAPTAGS